jgi:uncharacterized protein with FMN-binding domain
MSELPPPHDATAATPETPDDRARQERLAALARRRDEARPTAGPPVADGGERDAVAARLAALERRRPTDRPTAARPSVADGTPTSGRPRRRRPHPARGARLAALGLSLVSTGGLAVLFAATGASAGTEVGAARVVSTDGATAAASSAPASGSSTDAAATAGGSRPTDTIVDGAVFHNRWGDVQVEATFGADGALTDVTALRTPGGRATSVRINEYAVPLLNRSALTSQSADVDTVSGATYTSSDYRRSLQSAIDAARAAGVTAVA